MNLIHTHRGSLGSWKTAAGKVIGAAIEVHRSLGPGLLESAYGACLSHELTFRGIPFIRQIAVPVMYKGMKVDCAYRIDFLVGKSSSKSNRSPRWICVLSGESNEVRHIERRIENRA